MILLKQVNLHRMIQNEAIVLFMQFESRINFCNKRLWEMVTKLFIKPYRSKVIMHDSNFDYKLGDTKSIENSLIKHCLAISIAGFHVLWPLAVSEKQAVSSE